MVKVETHDVIIRYIRFRRGPSTNGGECSGDNLTLTNADKCIFDHCSFSWSTDEQANGWPATNVTFQWCIFSEALLNSTHSDNCDSAGPLQDHALGPLMGNTSKNITFYANLFAGNVGRNPQFAPTDGGRFQLVNNVIYDACFAVMNNGLNGKVMEINAIGNYIKEGPNSCDEHRNNILFKGDAKGYLKDNLTPYRNDGDPEWNASSEFRTCTPANTAFKADTPFETPALKTYSAVDAYKTVIDSAGANKSINNADLTVNNRDTIDLRAASYTKSGTARVGTKGLRVDSPSEVGGWPSYASATPYVDKDQDGMADAWEDEYGLNSSNGNDHNIDNDNDGYTNIEEFLNGTVPSLPTEIITPVKSGTGTHSKKSTKNYTLQGRRLGNELKKASGIRIEISTNGKMRFTVNHTRY
jgi:hypothetical protein